MKTNWQTKRLGDICAISAGNSAPQKKEFFIDGKYPFFRTSDVGVVHIGKIDQSADSLNDKGVKGMRLFKKNTILFPKSGASTFLNHRVIMEVDGYVSSHLATIKTDDSVLDSSYLFYFLQEIKAQDLIQDHKYPSLNLPVIEEIEVSYPDSLPEQKRIVKTLDEVFEKVAKAKENVERNLQNSKELFESYSRDIFDDKKNKWSKKRLSEVCSVERGSSPRPIQKYFTDSSDGVNWIKIGDTKNVDRYLYSTRQKITKGGAEKSREVIEGDLILSNSMSFGRPFIMKTKGYIHDGWFVLRPNSNIASEYFYDVISSPQVQEQFIVLASGSVVKNISGDLTKKAVLPLPSLSEQKMIVKKLKVLSGETKKLEKIYEQKLANLEELKKSLLNKAFTGELNLDKNKVEKTAIYVPSPYNPFKLNQVHAAIIEQVVRDGGETTEVAVAKYDHLLQEVFGLSLGYQFETHLFGPFDAKIKNLVSSGLGRNKWFTKSGGRIVLGSNISALISKQSNLYKDTQSVMKELATLGITKMNTDQIELLSTVCHSIKQTNSVEIETIRGVMDNWQTNNNQTKSQKFTLDRTKKCLDYITQKGLDKKICT